ncbi:hypothetical protein L2E82_10490 [Cichorium intybus]|uniref:Uncharacterized protein n=1 Tax=Cichorium intybus TaxID=13427 RepID=A0ACB9GAH8_CICIN|nr:hypothetical protein L2E82_10490 [Cichorium intybus]
MSHNHIIRSFNLEIILYRPIEHKPPSDTTLLEMFSNINDELGFLIKDVGAKMKQRICELSFISREFALFHVRLCYSIIRSKQEGTKEEDDGWEYIEEGPPKIICQGNEIIVKKNKVKDPKLMLLSRMHTWLQQPSCYKSQTMEQNTSILLFVCLFLSHYCPDKSTTSQNTSHLCI